MFLYFVYLAISVDTLKACEMPYKWNPLSESSLSMNVGCVEIVHHFETAIGIKQPRPKVNSCVALTSDSHGVEPNAHIFKYVTAILSVGLCNIKHESV